MGVETQEFSENVVVTAVKHVVRGCQRAYKGSTGFLVARAEVGDSGAVNSFIYGVASVPEEHAEDLRRQIIDVIEKFMKDRALTVLTNGIR